MHHHLQQALEAIQGPTRGLSPEQIGRPVPGQWSVGEILEHLVLAFAAGTAAIERALAAGQTKTRRPSLQEWLARTLVIDVGYFPRVKAPEGAVPTGTIAPDRVREALRESIVALDGALARGAARFGERTPLFDHPYFAGLTADQWRRFHWRHAVHHAKQVVARTRRG